MRTTVSITDELLAAAKLRARELGVSLGEVIDAYVFGSPVSGAWQVAGVAGSRADAGD